MAMRIVDVCAFYTPAGGGVRTYVEAKLSAAARFGHEVIIVAPGLHHETVRRGPGAFLVTVPSPQLPVDRRYRYFADEAALHGVLDVWQPDHVEASSPWWSATMVGRWRGAATRSLVMHCDPLAAYAYRWFGGIVSTATIDRLFGWFGVEADVFSPCLRCHDLRAAILGSLGLDSSGILLIGVGRLSAEKRWDMVLRAVRESAKRNDIGLLLVGDGPKRRRLELLTAHMASAAILPSPTDRRELARLMASADALVHGCEAETFCLVAAEAHASGIPLIVPDRGAAAGHAATGAGITYRAGDERALERAIGAFMDLRGDLQSSAASRASAVRTMDEHFAELFDRYASLFPGSRPIRSFTHGAPVDAEPLPQLALARSSHFDRR
jgi:alpha-1,6-mannosyltransferase